MTRFLMPALLAASSLVGALAVSLGPPRDGPVALIFPPWWSAAKTYASAASAGSVIRLGNAPFIAVVDVGPQSREALVARTGAVLTIDPQAVGGCDPSNG